MMTLSPTPVWTGFPRRFVRSGLEHQLVLSRSVPGHPPMAIYQTPPMGVCGQVLQEYLILQARTLRVFGHGWDLPAVLTHLGRVQETVCP